MIWAWIGFLLLIVILLGLDLGVFHNTDHVITIRESLTWTFIWITIALAFNVVIYFWYGHEKALQFFAGYLIEKSLSVDNLFVFLLIFTFFGVHSEYQHKVLFWGIIGALILRAILIGVGVTLISRFHVVMYLFGAFLIFSAIKMLLQKDEAVHPDKNPIVKLFRKIMPVTMRYHKADFFVKVMGHTLATPLFIVLLVIETTDVVFALDSIPAILGVSKDPFIVYSSNVFAILGLRALYFALAGIMGLFHYLKYGLSLILTFVGAKMIMEDIFAISIGVSLIVIVAILAASIFASMIWPPKAQVELPEISEDAEDE